MSNIVTGKLMIAWDGGQTTSVTEVDVDLDIMEVIEFGDQWYEGDFIPESQSELSDIEDEKIVLDDGWEFTAMAKDEYEYGLNLDLDTESEYDQFGNGIIVYEA